MNVDDYRKAYTAEIEKEKQSASGRFSTMAASGVPGDRLVADGENEISTAIAIFRDPKRPLGARLAALREIQTATFSGPGFNRYRSSFRDALRAVATEDTDQKLRASAIELLALDKDALAKQLLLKGLDNKAEAIVPTAKAMQLLAQDDHSVAIPVAHRIMNGNYDDDAKEEALRVLASDPSSSSLFAEILSDRSKSQRLRSASAAGLRAVNPQQFAQLAQRIIVDEGDNDEVRLSALGALTHMQGYSTKANSTFTDALSKLDLKQASADFRAATVQFLQARTPK
jgi:hypothetical protein